MSDIFDPAFSLSNLKSSVEASPVSAEKTTVRLFGTLPVKKTDTYDDTSEDIMAHLKEVYSSSNPVFSSSVFQKSGGCIIVTKDDKEEFSFRLVSALTPSITLSESGVEKVHSFVGLLGSEGYTRGGSQTSAKSLLDNYFFTNVTSPQSFLRFRVVHIRMLRDFENALSADHSEIHQQCMISIPHTAPSDISNPDMYCIKAADKLHKSGRFTQIALPCFFPIPLGVDFSFVDRIVLPSEVVKDGIWDDQAWKSFKEQLVLRGSNNSKFLDNPFFKLWVVGAISAPEIFHVDTYCEHIYRDMGSDLQSLALLSAKKILLDNEWAFPSNNKSTEACSLLEYFAFNPEDLKDTKVPSSFTKDGITVNIDAPWWKSMMQGLPTVSTNSKGWLKALPDTSPLKKVLQSRPAPIDLSTSPGHGASFSASNATTTTNIPGTHNEDSILAVQDDKSSDYSESMLNMFKSLFCLSLVRGKGNDFYIKKYSKFIDSESWSVFDVSSAKLSNITDKNYVLQGILHPNVTSKGSGARGLAYHKSVFSRQPHLDTSSLDLGRFFTDKVFGQFLQGVWSMEKLSLKNPFMGFSPIHFLLLQNFCTSSSTSGNPLPVLPATGFPTFAEILTFFDCITTTFQVFSNSSQSLPMITAAFELLKQKLQSSVLARDWHKPHVDKPKISYRLLELSHNFFANSAFVADQLSVPRIKLMVQTVVSNTPGMLPLLESSSPSTISSLNRHTIFDNLIHDIDGLLSSVTSNIDQLSSSTLQTKVDGFLFLKEKDQCQNQGDSGKRKADTTPDDSTKRSRFSKMLQASVGCHVCEPASKDVTIADIESRFGPSEVANRPIGGARKVKGKKFQHSPLCIRFMLGRKCDEKTCGYHLEVSPTSISGSASDYESLRSWFKQNKTFVIPSKAALANPILFPEGKAD